MRAVWSGSISFGLVNIPIKVYSGSQSETLDLDMLRKDDLCPVHFARVCRSDGREIPYEDIVKGYKYENGDYIVLTDEDFEKANVEKTKSIEILDFVDEKEIDPVYYEKPYFLEPGKNAGKLYLLLREALNKTGKVGIARFVFRNREHIAVVKPFGKTILLNQLRYHHEIRNYDDLKIPETRGVNEKELQMATELIDHLTIKFNPRLYRDTYNEELMKIIEDKAKGKKVKTKGQEPKPTRVIDLMATLKRSLKSRRHQAKAG